MKKSEKIPKSFIFDLAMQKSYLVGYERILLGLVWVEAEVPVNLR